MNTPKTIALFTLGLLLALSACGKKADNAPDAGGAEAPKADVANPAEPASASAKANPSATVLPPAPRIEKSDICPAKANKTGAVAGSSPKMLPPNNVISA